MTEERTTAPVPFSLAAWIGGFLVSLFIGAIGNVVADVLGTSFGNAFASGACGVIPGILLIAIGWSMKQKSPGLAGGLIVGGCIIALIGGACGAAMSGATFH